MMYKKCLTMEHRTRRRGEERRGEEKNHQMISRLALLD